ncbi:AAA family ATPase [Halocynthiibacter styelae]|uniref:AAA family ATPase n=1 Tax=Halocynthiibacter styelae TaxID=2761955 RepID=A0A8J7IR52_9RHOB|nr:AAA family ATPase [Paenihalocynthiibacter styelae]MBI1495376.1 AAA family ATPase [Paenihalocynthiibacter styelae]
MNVAVKQPPAGNSVWAMPQSKPAGCSDDVLSRWNAATDELRKLALEKGWSKSEVARRADLAVGTFSGWYDGTYKGRYDTNTAKIENFLAGFQAANAATAALPDDPGFVQTSIARSLFETFTYAQALPTMGVAIIGAGLGKTMAAEEFAATRPHVYHVTLSPSVCTPHKINVEIADALGINSRDSNSLRAKIIATLKHSGFSSLLIIDEAQNLDADCINELRYYHDKAKCGLVLLGNNEGKIPYKSSPQLHRRRGRSLQIMQPDPADAEMLLNAWKVKDPEVRRVAALVASKQGHFGSMTETLKSAAMVARGNGRAITADDIRDGYFLRGDGDLKEGK